MSVYRSAADLVARNPQADPSLQAQVDLARKVRQDQDALTAKKNAEYERKAEAAKKAAESGRIKGHARVKAVPTGDSVLLSGQPLSPGTLPPEKLLFLSGLEAPKLGRRGQKDQPFAWEAREFLRKLLVGKSVVFAVSYVHEGRDPVTDQPVRREYGNLLLGDEDVSKLLVSKGWARVKIPKNQPAGSAVPSQRQELLDLEEQAKADKVGIWREHVSEGKMYRTIEEIDKDRKKYEGLKKRSLRGIVEQVRDGSTVRIEAVNPDEEKSLSYYSFVLHIAGIQCPRVPPPYSVLYEQYLKKKESDPTLQPPVEERPAYLGPEAKLFTEMRLLNRDVEVQLLATDKSGNFFGTVLVPEGNIAVSLLKNGLAKLVEWSAHVTDESALLEAAQRDAQQNRLSLWQKFVPNQLSSGDKKDFTAKVIQIISGDTLVVVDNAGVELRLTLSSIRAPRLGAKPEAFASEAKEFMRKKLIGHKVQVLVEYVKSSDSERKDDQDRVYGSVFLNRKNVAEELVGAGLASVLSHRIDEQRSIHYDALLAAESKAEKTKKGKFSKTVPAAKPIIDLSEKVRVTKDQESDPENENAKKKKEIEIKQKQFLPFLQKQKSLEGTVDYVFGGNRFKIVIPKENCVVSFALSGIRCPLSGRKDGSGRVISAGEPFGDEAYVFAKDRIMQHDVTLVVENLDKGGNFVGSLFYGRNNLAVDLLLSGLAEIFAPSADKSKYREELYRAEGTAKANRIGKWHDWVEPKPEEIKEAAVAEANGDVEEEVEQKVNTVLVTEVLTPTSFYFHFQGKNDLATIQTKLTELAATAVNPVVSPQKGQVYGGLYHDKQWYRCRFEKVVDDQYQVFFIDYGNTDVVPSLRFLDATLGNLNKLKPAALLGNLSGLKTSKDYYDEALEAFGSFVFETEVVANVDFYDRTGNKYHLTLKESKDSELSINSLLLRDGLLRIASRFERRLSPVVKAFKTDENFARRNHYGIWQYGDVSSDEEEDTPATKRN